MSKNYSKDYSYLHNKHSYGYIKLMDSIKPGTKVKLVRSWFHSTHGTEYTIHKVYESKCSPGTLCVQFLEELKKFPSHNAFITHIYNLFQDEIDAIIKELKDADSGQPQAIPNTPYHFYPNYNGFFGINPDDYKEWKENPTKITPSESTSKPVEKKHKCHCDWNDVLRYGCRCGGQ